MMECLLHCGRDAEKEDIFCVPCRAIVNGDLQRQQTERDEMDGLGTGHDGGGVHWGRNV